MQAIAAGDQGVRDGLALRLVEALYRAAIERSRWDDFAGWLSEALNGAAVTVAIRHPGSTLGWDYAGSGARDLAILVAEQLQESLEHAADQVEEFRRAFVSLGEAYPRVVLERNAFFEQWMRPRSLAPEWPLCHAVEVDGAIVGWVLVQCRAGAPFDVESALAFCNPLVPHLTRSLAIHAEIAAQHHKRSALEEILDRLAAGVILIDARRQVIRANLSASRMLALEDGVAICDGELRASSAEDSSLQEAIGKALEAASRGEQDHMQRIAVSSQSGGRPYFLNFTPLLEALPGSPVHEAVIVAFFANPDAVSDASVRALEAVFGLTPAEAAVVRGLVDGRTLDEVAASRGVRPDTVRGQLKQVFVKTGTSRQVDLIRLVLTGISPLSAPIEDRLRSKP